jgi:peptide/nickel transport system substrate-binding protein
VSSTIGLRATVLAAAAATSFAGCARIAEPRALPPHVLRLADSADPSSLNPLLAHDQATIGYDLLFVQTLVGLSRDNRVVPILVTRVPSRANGDISPDGRTITYHLRRGVRFADGRPLTSADVAFTFRAIMDPRNPVLSQDAYRRVLSLVTPDPSTVVIRLRSPWNAAVRELFAQADFAFGILPAHAFAGTAVLHAPWEERAFGSGPFRVTQWRRGDRIVLEPNPYFSPRPKLARIELRMIPNDNAGLVALRAGEVDVTRLRPSQVRQIASLPGLRVVTTPLNDTTYLTLQTAAAPTDDVRVRRAIAQALDIPKILRLYFGLYPQAGSFVPAVLSVHDATLRPLEHDAVAAAAELEAAGWHLQGGARSKNGMPLELLLVMESNEPGDLEAIVQRQLADAGIRVTIKPFPVSAFNAPEGPIRNGRYNLSSEFWIGGADPEQSVVFACDQIGADGNNTSRFCDPRFQAAYQDQAVTNDERRRARDFTLMQRIVYDRIPAIPLYYQRYLEGMNARVAGFARNMLMFPVDAESWDV